MNKIEKQGCTSTLSENGFTNPDKPNSNLASKLFKPFPYMDIKTLIS